MPHESIFKILPLLNSRRRAGERIGQGSLTFDDSTGALTCAAAFVDQKDERKPVILLLSDKKLPTEKWKSEFDMMFDGSKFNGIVFFLDKEGKVFRTDVALER